MHTSAAVIHLLSLQSIQAAEEIVVISRFKQACVVLILSTVAMCSLAACGNTSDPEGGGEQPGTGKTVGVIAHSLSDPTSSLAAGAYEDELNKLGYETVLIDSQGNAGAAVNGMQNLAQRKVDAIWVQTWEASQVQAGLRASNAAGVPVMSFGGGLGGEDGFRHSTNFGLSAGTVLGEEVVGTTEGRGQMLMIGYQPGLIARLREQGAMNVLGKRPDIEINRKELNLTDINGWTSNTVAAWLSAHPKDSSETMMVFVPSACCTAPAISAIRQAGRDDIRVFGFVDGAGTVLRDIQSGAISAAASDDLASMARSDAQLTPQVIERGIEAPQTESVPDAQLVTIDNVAEYASSHPEIG